MTSNMNKQLLPIIPPPPKMAKEGDPEHCSLCYKRYLKALENYINKPCDVCGNTVKTNLGACSNCGHNKALTYLIRK